ncbi:SDR family oxidoreductase [Bacillus sp. CECT 9360]|uniref:SDR family oxidoreductase n=1 Tax=Bacillus sp. CECT 9360 TaxID=2845821 RepID=UPI001E4E8211|nr:SDR family oxidoreductase [Bacillus sp. CECT 9360]CAH0345888.1 3-oxoacyl-[acyl-carrier-protein] reductase FabG [Bacillus sp. CECT 9360]
MDYQLTGKNAIVVASSKGLGKAIAAELLKEGANVLIVSRDENKLAAVQSELSELGKGRIIYSQADVRNYEEIKEMVEKAVSQLGGIDILVNNAGGPPAGSFEQMTDHEWQNSFELNLLSYIRTIRECLPYLKKRGGKIINIASSSIKEPIPGLILSNTFRTAIVGLSKTLAEEFAPYGIIINTVAPGRIATDRVRHLDEVNAEKNGISVEEVEENVKSNIPLGRYGKPEEFARVVTFLVSDANTYMTGSAFLVDGGMIKSI